MFSWYNGLSSHDRAFLEWMNTDELMEVWLAGEPPAREVKKWWDKFSSAGRTRMCDMHTEIVGKIRRWETLTENEIKLLYFAEHPVPDEHTIDMELEQDLWNQPTGTPPIGPVKD